MGLGLPEAVNAPANRLLIAIRGNFTGDCSSLFQHFHGVFYILNFFFVFLCLGWKRPEGSFANDLSIELTILCNGRSACCYWVCNPPPAPFSIMTKEKQLKQILKCRPYSLLILWNEGRAGEMILVCHRSSSDMTASQVFPSGQECWTAEPSSLNPVGKGRWGTVGPENMCRGPRIESDLIFKQFPPIHEQRIGQILRKSHFFQCKKPPYAASRKKFYSVFFLNDFFSIIV